MKVRNWKLAAIAAMTVAMLAVTGWRPPLAQTPPSRGITLYEDVKTGALYRKPGRGRVAVTLGLDEPAAPPPAVVQRQVQQQLQQNIRSCAPSSRPINRSSSRKMPTCARA
jgi:hypothetical protein